MDPNIDVYVAYPLNIGLTIYLYIQYIQYMLLQYIHFLTSSFNTKTEHTIIVFKFVE